MTEFWIRVHANLSKKPIVFRAVQSLCVSRAEAVGLLVTFWGGVSQFVPGGRVSEFNDDALEALAEWHGDRGRFAAFIRSFHLDEFGRPNEWDVYAGALERRRATERDRLRNKRKPSPPPADIDSGLVAQHEAYSTPVVATHARERYETTRDDTTKAFDNDVQGAAEVSNAQRHGGRPKRTPEEQRVFDHYRRVHPARRPGVKDLSVLRTALESYTADELCEAIDGNLADEWHRERHKHELSYVLGDNGRIDNFRGIALSVRTPLVDENGIPTERGVAMLSGVV